jgi:hypothetical protein
MSDAGRCGSQRTFGNDEGLLGRGQTAFCDNSSSRFNISDSAAIQRRILYGLGVGMGPEWWYVLVTSGA